MSPLCGVLRRTGLRNQYLTIIVPAALVAACSVQAATITWSGGTDSVWNTNPNWSGNLKPTVTDTAKFSTSPTSSHTIDLGTSAATVNTVLFDTSTAAAFTIGSGTVDSQKLYLHGSGGITVNSTVVNTQLFNAKIILGDEDGTQAFTFTNDSGSLLTLAGTVGTEKTGTKSLRVTGTGNTTISGIISNGAGSLTKTGNGTLILSGANTYTGVTTLESGTLRATTSAQALGTGAATLSLKGGILELANTADLTFGRNTTVAGSATIRSEVVSLGPGLTYTLGTLSIGTYTLTVDKGGNVDSGTAEVTFGATTLSASGAVFNTLGGALLTLASVSGSNYGFTVLGAGNTMIGGAISTGTGSLTKDGGGTLTLGGTNTYSGATTVSGGKLTINASGTINSSSGVSIGGGNFNYNSSTALSKGVSFSGPGGTLSGSGTITPAITVTSGNSYTAGAVGDPGTQTFTAGLAFNSGSVFQWDLDASTSDPGANTANSGTYDRVVANGPVTGNAVFTVVLGTNAFTDPFWDTNKTWTNILSGPGSFNLSTLFTTFGGAGVATDGTVAGQGRFTTSATTLNWTTVPEPSGVGVGFLLVAGFLRRRRPLKTWKQNQTRLAMPPLRSWAGTSSTD